MNAQTSHLMEQCGTELAGRHTPEQVTYEMVDGLVGLYGGEGRYHHTGEHLQDVVDFLVEVKSELRRPRPTLWAALGHDSIYLPENGPGVNERLSGALTVGLVMPYLPRQEVRLIDRYIQATATHEWNGADMDLAYFLDADMKILGAPPEEFEEYDANIRCEYSMYDETAYRAGRLAVLKGFYDNPRLFITDIADERFKDQAKANLERKIDELSVS